MPVIPFIPLIAAGVGVGGSIASSKISSKAAKDAEERARNSPEAIAQRQLLEQQKQYGAEAHDVYGRLQPKYEDNVGFFVDRFRKLLGSDNKEALSVISPLVRARKNQTAAALRMSEFAPRGGGTNEATARIYDDERGDVLDMLTNARNEGENKLLSLTGDIGARAAGYHGEATGTGSNAVSLLGQMGDRVSAAGDRARASSGEAAYSIGQAIGPLLLELLSKKNTTSKSAPPLPDIWDD